MVKEILTAAGFVENKTFRETMFVKAPKGTYVVFLDQFERRGADGLNLIKAHSVTIELYSDVPDSRAEQNVEKALDDRGLEYDKQDRYWILEEQLYQTIYTFNYIEK